MRMSVERTREDFDLIAELEEPRWHHNGHYYTYLLSLLPSRMEQVLEVGCGRGDLSRLLARRAGRVQALDLSPRMIGQARASAGNPENIDWIVADVLEWQGPDQPVDAIVSVATLHHLPLEETLSRWSGWLRPGGRIVVLDLRRDDGMVDRAISLAALPASMLRMAWHNGRLRPSPTSRDLWDRHGRDERYLSFAEARATFARILPGAIVRRHLYWRYSAFWIKP